MKQLLIITIFLLIVNIGYTATEEKVEVLQKIGVGQYDSQSPAFKVFHMYHKNKSIYIVVDAKDNTSISVVE